MPTFVIHNDKEIRGFFGPYRFLSNFWSSIVLYEGYHFPSVEHAYHFAKLKDIHFENDNFLKFIDLKPGEVKKWGHTIKIRDDWDGIKYNIMAGLVFDKFYRNLDLRNRLRGTKGKYLEESNVWHDNYFGNCYCDNCKNIEGQNNLGKILMKVRDFWQ